MECYCDYGDPPEFYHKQMRHARKLHRCSECSRAITAGENYEHVWGKWDASPETFRTCQRCLALKEWVGAHVPCACWMHGNLREEAMENAISYAHEAPGLLFRAYRLAIMIDRNVSYLEAVK